MAGFLWSPLAKDGTPGLKQQRLPLGLPDTAADRKVADNKRKRLQRELDQGTFSWDDWLEPTAGITWRQAIDQLHCKRVVNGRTGESMAGQLHGAFTPAAYDSTG